MRLQPIPKYVPPGIKLTEYQYEFYRQLIGRSYYEPIKSAWVRKTRRKTRRF